MHERSTQNAADPADADRPGRDADRRIAELEARVADLVARLDGASPAHDTATSRRTALRLAGAAMAGAVGVAVTGRSAAADAGDPVLIGETDNISDQLTRNTYTGAQPGQLGFLFQAAGNNNGGNNSNASPYGAAVGGWSRSGAVPSNGIYGRSENPNAFGVVGENDLPTGTGVVGVSAGGTGVFGTSTTGIGISGITTSPDRAGVMGQGGFAGVLGFSGDYSLAAQLSNKANLYLQPHNNLGDTLQAKTVPSARTDAHRQGEIDNVGGDLWYCVVGGNPGVWRKIAGPLAAGAFHAVTPARVFDSRAAQPTPGMLTVGVPLLVSVAAARDLETGAVTNPTLVPAGATAVLANVTVANTVGAGFLTINPGTTTAIGSSSINWSASGQILNNGVSLTLGGDRQVTVIPGGSNGAATDLIIDITGYFL